MILKKGFLHVHIIMPFVKTVPALNGKSLKRPRKLNAKPVRVVTASEHHTTLDPSDLKRFRNHCLLQSQISQQMGRRTGSLIMGSKFFTWESSFYNWMTLNEKMEFV